MPDSIRQQVTAAFATRLTTITTANEYNLNLGSNVNEWRVNPLGQDELPGIVWRDTDDVVEATTQQDVHTLTIEVDIFVAGTTAPTQMRQAIADVVAAIGTDPTFGGLAVDARVVSEKIESDQEERRVVGITLTCVVEFYTDHLDPYNQ